jgi:hypothetical protein
MKIYVTILVLNFLTNFAQAQGTFAHPRWCELTAKKEVGPYINAAAGFVGIDPSLLAIGMSSEGFAVKQDCITRTSDVKKAPSDADLIKAMNRACEQDRFKALNLYTVADGQSKAPSDQWSEAQKYAPANATFVTVDPDTGFTDIISTRKAIELSFYGGSWIDDGSDTFGLEYFQLREKKYLPSKFISSDYEKVKANNMNQMPDFVFMNDESDRNESAKNRFKTNQGPFLERFGRQSPTQGDKGKTHYKTPEAQVFANAALWKHSQDKFNSAKKELIALYKSKGSSSPDYGKAAFLEREMSPTETAFWSKVFYNGGQGTQAGAWDVLKQFADRGWLANDNYLRVDPGVSLKEIYHNGREVSDSYTEIKKTTACTDQLASRAGNIKTEDYTNVDTNSSSGNRNSGGNTIEH